MAMHHVLLVHADRAVQELATRVLGHVGVDVKVESEASAAADHLSMKHYPVVVIDHAGMEPVAATSLLSIAARQQPRPVVIVTSDDQNHTVDPDVVSVIVPSSDDPRTLIGVIVACANERGLGWAGKAPGIPAGQA